MANINILVGSVTGKALSAGSAIQEVFNGQGHHAQLFANAAIEQVTDEAVDVLLIVTSSTGQGDLPASLVPLYAQLQSEFPLIPNKKFAVVALGDSSYSTFCQAGATMEELMFELQGQALCERFNIDACEHFNPLDAARGWALDCVKRL
ncbi:MAG: flavodoxin domain-containing protein [Bermanella sp.]